MIRVQTPVPSSLLTKIRRAIDSKKVVTWGYDRDGDFTHTPSQWERKAWLRPSIVSGELQFKVIRNENVALTEELYGVYVGRFVEMLLAHFKSEFSVALAN